MRISPSIASSNLLDIRSEIKRVESFGCNGLHIDIEDGNFVPNITFGVKLVKLIRSVTDLTFSYHLMVTDPLKWISDIPNENTDIIFVHAEALNYPKYVLNIIKSRNIRSGLAFNPVTELDSYKYLVDFCDAIMVMTSEPDGIGDTYIEAMESKVIKACDYGFKEIWVDGALNEKTMSIMEQNGATDAVLGRNFFRR